MLKLVVMEIEREGRNVAESLKKAIKEMKNVQKDGELFRG